VRELVKRLLPEAMVAWIRGHRLRHGRDFARLMFSQEGEDGILARMFEMQKTGFYVDVGAHHPARFSNTYYFYMRGWHGINVEPNPDLAALFHRLRPRDTTVQAAVSDIEGQRTYFLFDDPALNTFDEQTARQRAAHSKYRIVARIQLPLRRLDKILDELLPGGAPIDFLSIDVEGLDTAVVRSLDWTRYRPRVVLVELPLESLQGALNGECNKLMSAAGYVAFAKTVNTVFFVEQTALKELGLVKQ